MFKFLFFLILIFGYPALVSAHDLIPKELQVFIERNPSATPEEIKIFIDQQNPEFSKKFKNGEEIVNIIRDRKTSVFDNAVDFIKLGVLHILSGLDHILFVLSLLLVFVSIMEILRLTATFTIAHSITLILSGLGIITLSPKITEPLIALSIFYVAVTSVFFSHRKFIGSQKAKIVSVFFFGLFHGLGFAGLLKEIQIPADKFISSLFSFNIGIEIGQLFIIFLSFPFIYYFRNKLWYGMCIKVFAICIAVISLFWILQRIFFV
ncbi:HupE/UreJ family protein [Arenimonas sp.]|nr:HupE/UreJ family protein [Candidatus Parcubacteria bacterium]